MMVLKARIHPERCGSQHHEINQVYLQTRIMIFLSRVIIVKIYIETFDSGETKKIWNDIKDCFYVIIIDWVFPIIYSGRDMPQYELVTQSICHLTNDDGVF